MRAVIEDITPEKAMHLLQKNSHNRNLRAGVVKKYATDMRLGKWELSTDGITINKDGELVNGQHRLNAVIESGCTVKMLVCYDSECTVFDINVVRSETDWFFYKYGVKLPDRVYGCAQMYYHIMYGIKAPSHAQKELFCLEYLNELILADSICNKKSVGKRILANKATIFAVLSALLCGVSEDKLREFCEIANSGFPKEGVNSTAPLAYRNYILVFSKAKNGTFYGLEKTNVCQNAIAKFIAGQGAKYLRSTKGYFFTDKAFKKD